MSRTKKGGKGAGYEFDSFWLKGATKWNLLTAKDSKRHAKRCERLRGKKQIEQELKNDPN